MTDIILLEDFAAEPSAADGAGSPTPVPGACLLVADDPAACEAIEGALDGLIAGGCRWFMSWGDAADALEDAVDRFLEDRGGACLDIVTTSHRNEPADEVAAFLLHATLRGEPDGRFYIGFERASAAARQVVQAARALHRVRP